MARAKQVYKCHQINHDGTRYTVRKWDETHRFKTVRAAKAFIDRNYEDACHR
jgi:hypothetical protein